VSSSPAPRRFRPPLSKTRAPRAPPRCSGSPPRRNRARVPRVDAKLADSVRRPPQFFANSGQPRRPPAKPTPPSRSGRRCAPPGHPLPSLFFLFSKLRRVPAAFSAEPPRR
jgi:hypothetical protein